MADNATVAQPDGSVRARIMQGTQQAIGPLLIGVMGAHATPVSQDGRRAPQARLEVLAHRELEIPSPGVVGLDTGESLHLEGIGELVLVHVEEPAEHPVPSESDAGQRATIFLEFWPS